jgi:hypothetical protein
MKHVSLFILVREGQLSPKKVARTVTGSKNWDEVFRKLSLANHFNYSHYDKFAVEHDIDISHFVRRAGTGRRKPLSETLVLRPNGSARLPSFWLKRRLFEEGLMENVCSVCGLKPKWNGKPLVLVLDHINGLYYDYRLENLRLVCPNCNSQLDTHSGRNKGRNGSLSKG